MLPRGLSNNQRTGAIVCFVRCRASETNTQHDPLRDRLMPLTLCGSIYIQVWPAYELSARASFAGIRPLGAASINPPLIGGPLFLNGSRVGLCHYARLVSWPIATRSPPGLIARDYIVRRVNCGARRRNRYATRCRKLL